MGEILDLYIFSGEKKESKFKHVAEKLANFTKLSENWKKNTASM
jgi:hypothetical protein